LTTPHTKLGLNSRAVTMGDVEQQRVLVHLRSGLPVGTASSSGLSHEMSACILQLRAAYVTPGGAAVAGAGRTLSTAIAG
jgi:hypothetical protein